MRTFAPCERPHGGIIKNSSCLEPHLNCSTSSNLVHPLLKLLRQRVGGCAASFFFFFFNSSSHSGFILKKKMFQVRQGFTSAAIHWFRAATETNGNAPAVPQHNGRVNVSLNDLSARGRWSRYRNSPPSLRPTGTAFSQLRSQQV